MSMMHQTNPFRRYEDIPILMSANDIMRTVPLSKDSVYRLIHSQQFPVIRITGRHLVRKEELFKWLKQQEREWR